MLNPDILRHPTAPAAAGFTLIEILVALAVLSLGLLGLAAMNLTALTNSQASYERSIAVMQANDLVERMWAGLCEVHDEGEFVESEADDIKAAWEDAHEDTLSALGWRSPALDYTDAVSGVAGTVVELQIIWDERTPQPGEPPTMQFTHRFRLPPVDCPSVPEETSS